MSWPVVNRWRRKTVSACSRAASAGVALLLVVCIPAHASMHVVGSVPTTDYPVDVAVLGSYAYVTDGSLRVIDISGSPQIVATLATSGPALGIAVRDTLAYVADGLGLAIIDISDPSLPTLLGRINTSGQAWKVALSDTLAFVADKTGLQLVNVSNPSSPSLLGRVPAVSRILNVAASGSTCFVSDGFCDWGGGIVCSNKFYLRAIDASDPANPQIVSTTELMSLAAGMEVAGHYLFVAMKGLGIFDITDPSTPITVGTAGPSLWFSEDVAVAGSLAYLGNWQYGLQAIDISNISAPRIVGSIQTREGPHNVAFQGGYCYLTDYYCAEACAIDQSQFLVIDVSDPTPVHVTSFAGQIQNSGFLITWSAVDVSGVAGFHIERSADGGSDFQRITERLISPAGPYQFTDTSVQPGASYTYRLLSIDRFGQTEILAYTSFFYSAETPPRLLPAYPNPVSGLTTMIPFSLPSQGTVRMRVLDARGNLVRDLLNKDLDAGKHSVLWDGRDNHDAPVPGGVYFYHLEALGHSMSERVIWLR